ncbi:MAG: MATE family efflux transporter [Lachnospiraceae bacterium]|nr:MATE family efflux transporter [Lachnospiraceae bacterium]
MKNVSEKRTYIFESAPIPKAVLTLAIPTIITQLINVIYNYADTWYVGRTGNAAAVAAMNISMPIFILLAAIANLFGAGGASLISRMLGRKQPEQARHVFAFSFWFGIATAVVYAIVIFLTRSELIYLIGGDENSHAFANDYMFWTVVIGAIPTVGNVLCGHLVRSIGASKEAGIGMSLGGVMNIILDPLFMFVILPPGMEVIGAAIATMLSNTVAFAYFLIYFLRHRDNPIFTLNPKDISLKDRIPVQVLTIGFPAALQTSLAMVSNIFANKFVSGYGTDAVSGLGVAKKVNMLAFNTMMGLTMGVTPLVGYNIGAKNYDRMKKAIRFTGLLSESIGITCLILFNIFAAPLISFFINEPKSVEFGSAFLHVVAFAVPLCSVTFLFNAVFQAAGQRMKSLVLSTLRKGLLDVPLMAVLSITFSMGATGVVLATPLAEVISTGLAIFLYLRFLKSLKTQEEAPEKSTAARPEGEKALPEGNEKSAAEEPCESIH